MHKSVSTIPVLSVVLVGSLSFFAAGCAAIANDLRYEILFASNGTERAKPSIDLEDRLSKADDAARRRMIPQLMRIICTDGGYASVAAARGLLWFLDENPQYYNPELVAFISDNIIAISPWREKVYWMAAEAFVEPNMPLPKDLERGLSPECYVLCENRASFMYVPGVALPYKWRAYGGGVSVDEKAIILHPEPYEMKDGFTQFPRERCDLRKALLTGEKGKPLTAGELVGEHELKSWFTVVGPDGSERRVERKVTLLLLSRSELFTDPF